jgi:hypothetical protein
MHVSIPVICLTPQAFIVTSILKRPRQGSCCNPPLPPRPINRQPAPDILAPNFNYEDLRRLRTPII